MSEATKIDVLEGFKWTFLAVERALQVKVKRRITRLARHPSPRDAQLIAGTMHVYRLWVGEARVLYHYRERRITLLSLSLQRTESQVDALLKRLQLGSSGSGRGTHGGGTLSRKAARPA